MIRVKFDPCFPDLCPYESSNKQKIKNLKIIQDRLLFTSSCYRDPFQFFIGYNLLIQIAGSEASSFAVSSEDIDKERLTAILSRAGIYVPFIDFEISGPHSIWVTRREHLFLDIFGGWHYRTSWPYQDQ